MDAVSFLVTGVLVAVAGYLGLFLAANAVDGTIYPVGLLLFVFAVAFDFWLVKRWYDSAAQRA